jgi:CheY-like chemotaxis protein
VAGKGIQINFLANVRDFLRGTGDVDAAFERVSSSLDNLARDGDHAGDLLQNSLEAVARETNDTQSSFRDLARGVEVSSRNAGRDFQQNIQRGATNARAAIKETKNEALQNASETFSSFDGTTQSFVDGIQGTFGGLVASLGAISPALIPIGVAGGLAIGLISAGLQDADQNTEEFKADVADLIGQMLEAGTTGRRTFGQIADDVAKLAQESDDSKTNLKDLRDVAEQLKVPLRDVVYAYEQGGDALDTLISKSDDLSAASQKNLDLSIERANAGGYEAATALQAAERQTAALNTVNNTLTVQKEKLDAAAEASQLAADAGLTSWQLKADLIGQVDQAYDDAAGAASDYIKKETGLLDVSAYIKAMKRRQDALIEYQQTLAEAELTPEARKFLESQGQESAAAFLQGYKKATPKQKAELNEIWTEAGKTDSGTYTEALTSSFKTTVPGPAVSPTLDTSDLDKALEKYASKTVNVTVQLRDPLGRKIS